MRLDEVVKKYVDLGKQRKLLLLTSIAWMFDAAGVMLTSFVLVHIVRDWNLSYVQGAAFASSTFLGMLFGALSAGLMADLFGRKVSNIVYYLFTVTFTFLSGFAPSFPALLAFRALSGFGYGGLMPSFNAYLSEFTSVEFRGRYLVLLEASWAVGSILIGLFAVFVLPNWRWCFWVFSLGYAFLPLFLRLPESPKYALLKGGKEGLEKALGFKIGEEVEVPKKEKVPLIALLKREHAKKTLLVWFSWFVVSFVYYALFTWAPKIFSNVGIGVVRASWFTFYMMVAQLPGYLSAAYLIEKWGRRPSLGFYFVGTGLSALVWGSVRGDVSLLLAALLLSFFCLGVWGLVYAYTPELYPTPFRGTGNGAAGVWARIAGMVAPFYLGYMMDKGKGLFETLFWIAVLSMVAGVMVWLFGEETKGKYVD